MNDIIFFASYPEELRQLSNYTHLIEGAIFLSAAFILFLKATGWMKEKKADMLCPELIFDAGVFLIVYIFVYHPLAQMGWS